MSKPHEETWIAEEGDIITSSGQAIFDEGMQAGSKAEHEPRVYLAVQAPAMARLLLRVGGHGPYAVNDDGFRECVVCGGYVHAVHEPAHAPDCELAAVLRAAGVLR